MANESMTVEQACEKIASVAKEMHESDYGEVWSMAFEVERCNKAVLAAHKREIADFQRRYDECVRRFNEADIERVRLRDEVAAKDAEMLSLKSKIDEYERQPELMADVATKSLELHKRQDAEIASLKSLVKEMADILKLTSRKYFECEEQMCVFCGKKCGRNEATRLINKAREVCNG